MKRKPRGYWTFERIKEVALKYETRGEFEKKNKVAYRKAMKQGWDIEICKHMKYICRPRGYWTFERVKEVALKCETRNEFIINHIGAYNAAIKGGYYNEINTHMIPQKSLIKRHVYLYEFSDNHVYVGLTWNMETRNKDHLGLNKRKYKTSVLKHIEKTKNIPHLILLTKIPIIEEDAIMLELKYIEKYKNDGWFLLNIKRGGSLGSKPIKWTKLKVKKEALKYSYRTEFKEKSNGAYYAARRLDILDELFPKNK